MRSRTRLAFCAVATLGVVVACGWDPSHPFERDAPAVKEAIVALDAGDAHAATDLLERYLSTGECTEGNIGTPDSVKEKNRGSFDLGLALFQVGESFGGRFGDEEVDAGLTQQQQADRSAHIDCALRVVQAIAEQDTTPLDLRAHARYLEGNLHFLLGDYEAAVAAYDKALAITPGMNDAGDPYGRSAAWNRAIAQRRIEDKKDAGQDASNDSASDAPNDAPGEGGGDSGGGDGGGDGGGTPDSSADGGQPPPAQDAAPPPPPSKSQDDRMLDQLEHAPTVQEEAAKRQAKRRVVHGTADK
jgi:tetratricopeptide (TPR) repeat protein